jgi:hypothetical protein
VIRLAADGVICFAADGVICFAADGVIRLAADGVIRTYSTGFTADVESTATSNSAGMIIDGKRICVLPPKRTA